MVDWLHAHLAEPLRAEDAARIAHISPAAFSRFFKRELGKTFTDYLNDARCSAAAMALRHWLRDWRRSPNRPTRAPRFPESVVLLLEQLEWERLGEQRLDVPVTCAALVQERASLATEAGTLPTQPGGRHLKSPYGTGAIMADGGFRTV